jgi:hypothetical protein
VCYTEYYYQADPIRKLCGGRLPVIAATPAWSPLWRHLLLLTHVLDSCLSIATPVWSRLWRHLLMLLHRLGCGATCSYPCMVRVVLSDDASPALSGSWRHTLHCYFCMTRVVAPSAATPSWFRMQRHKLQLLSGLGSGIICCYSCMAWL